MAYEKLGQDMKMYIMRRLDFALQPLKLKPLKVQVKLELEKLPQGFVVRFAREKEQRLKVEEERRRLEKELALEKQRRWEREEVVRL